METKGKDENASDDGKMNAETSANTNGIENNKNIEKSTGENCNSSDVDEEEMQEYLKGLNSYEKLCVDDIHSLEKDFIINIENNSNENNKENNGCVDGENNDNAKLCM